MHTLPRRSKYKWRTSVYLCMCCHFDTVNECIIQRIGQMRNGLITSKVVQCTMYMGIQITINNKNNNISSQKFIFTSVYLDNPTFNYYYFFTPKRCGWKNKWNLVCVFFWNAWTNTDIRLSMASNKISGLLFTFKSTQLQNCLS